MDDVGISRVNSRGGGGPPPLAGPTPKMHFVRKRDVAKRKEAKDVRNATQGYNEGAHGQVSGRIGEERFDDRKADVLEIPEVNRQVKIFSKHPCIVDCLRAFLNDCVWAKAEEGTPGAIWIEILAAFDKSGHRTRSCNEELSTMDKNGAAERRKRRGALGKRKSKAGEQLANAEPKVKLSDELELSKKLIRKLVQTEGQQSNRELFLRDPLNKADRYGQFAIPGFQPSIAGVMVMTPSARRRVQEAILTQKKGMTTVKAKGRMDFVAEAEEDFRFTLKKGRFTMVAPKLWTVRLGADVGHSSEDKVQEKPSYDERNLACLWCGHDNNTDRIQLHVHDATPQHLLSWMWEGVQTHWQPLLARHSLAQMQYTPDRPHQACESGQT